MSWWQNITEPLKSSSRVTRSSSLSRRAARLAGAAAVACPFAGVDIALAKAMVLNALRVISRLAGEVVLGMTDILCKCLHMSMDQSSSDYPVSRGSAAIGARLRRLSDRIDNEIGELYLANGVAFQQRWYGTFNQVRLMGPISGGEIARHLRVTHVTISQVSTALVKAGLVQMTPDPSDSRRRLLSLTVAGVELAEKMDAFWTALEALSSELNDAAGDLLSPLGRLEAALDREPITVRFQRLTAVRNGLP